ncbi:MAG TPA: carbon-nitrogen hydrolase family protein [Fimbriiglobus sp.]|nr:carbon-nitrogen hydrolase family protein [Fimbriiglobus sp.]
MFHLLSKPCLPVLCVLLLGVGQPTPALAGDDAPKGKSVIRVAAAQPRNRTIDFRLKPTEVLTQVDKSLTELEAIVHKAGKAGCGAVALPEDTLGLGKWQAAHPTALRDVLPEAVARMLDRLGKAAATHRMYLVCCNDTVEPDGTSHNTAFLLGPDGKPIGKYHKVNLPLPEQGHARGDKFPVFKTPDLGTVGMLICYDMVFPEAPRCLALQGADVIFHPTLGGAAIGDDDISLAAFRTRAVENFVWLVVAMRGHGSMIISPQGKIVAEAKGEDGLAIADIDPAGGRQGGDAFNTQQDMRGRLFRERVPSAYGVLTDPNPPVLAKVKSNVTKEEAIRIMEVGLTTGEERFNQAQALARAGKTDEAIRLFEKLCDECRTSWIDRVGRERLKRLRQVKQDAKPKSAGIAAEHPGDVGIAKDPRVVFAEDFEAKELASVTGRWETASGADNLSLTGDVPAGSGGKKSLLVTHVGGQGTGGQLFRRLKPGHDKLYARFYVKFDPDCAPIHHFGTHIGGYNPTTPWPQGFAGRRPAGDKTFTVGVEPFGENWAWDFYSYWCEMRGSPPKGLTWGNCFIRDPKLKVERGKWVCVEFMVKMNDVGDTNGEAALWIDGKPVAHLGKGFPKGKWVYDKFLRGEGGEGVRWSDAKGGPEWFTVPEGGAPFDGFRWRTAKELNLNYVWLYAYITKAAKGHVSRIWFDDVVIATEYIGPIKREDPGGR